jgi:hypothetical protein
VLPRREAPVSEAQIAGPRRHTGFPGFPIEERSGSVRLFRAKTMTEP